ncbi:MAG: hypothetical protein KAT74_02955 [Candidatus Cloacimonetes bacterium]|nr:hypothetical protein [Candidatus Cloacimonadota bacterium]
MSKINKKYLINLQEDEMDQPIYRYIKFDYLFELLLKSKKNTLVKPFKWNDPYEIFMSNLVINHVNNSESSIGLREFKHTYYAQCWTMKQECDLMWKVYVPKNGVKLKTTIRKLYNSISLQSLAKINERTKEIAEVYIGKVKYLQREELLDSDFFDLKKLVSNWPINKDEMVKTLFVKRKEFKSEDEVRIVLNTNFVGGKHKDLDDKVEFTFDDMIDEIVIDPRVNEKVFSCYKKVIEDYGFKGEIKHSDLYDFEINDKKVGDKIISKELY